MTTVYPPTPSSYPMYTRPYPHGIPLSITTRNLPAVEWQPIHSDCDSPVDGYPLQSSAPVGTSQPYSALYGQPNTRTWSSLNERPIAAISNVLDKEQGGAPMPYLSSAVAPRPIVTTEGASSFNVVGLQSSLPRAPATNRQLPMPTMAMRQIPAPHNVEDTPLRVLQGSSTLSREASYPIYHSGGSWTHEHYPGDYRNGSLPSPTSAGQIETLPASISSAAPSTSSTSPNSYTETSSSPGSSPNTMTSLHEAASASVTTPSVIHAATALSHIGSYHNTAASNHGIHRNDSGSNLADYQYSLDKPNSLGDVHSGNDTLSNGQRYEPIPVAQPQPERVANVKAIRHESWENGNTLVRRASLTGHDRTY